MTHYDTKTLATLLCWLTCFAAEVSNFHLPSWNLTIINFIATAELRTRSRQLGVRLSTLCCWLRYLSLDITNFLSPSRYPQPYLSTASTQPYHVHNHITAIMPGNLNGINDFVTRICYQKSWCFVIFGPVFILLVLCLRLLRVAFQYVNFDERMWWFWWMLMMMTSDDDDRLLKWAATLSPKRKPSLGLEPPRGQKSKSWSEKSLNSQNFCLNDHWSITFGYLVK